MSLGSKGLESRIKDEKKCLIAIIMLFIGNIYCIPDFAIYSIVEFEKLAIKYTNADSIEFLLYPIERLEFSVSSGIMKDDYEVGIGIDYLIFE
ncbi:MAG: hypothetical protein APR54_02935 [Candidatus Cloacimonas sp. SDB]|nr:MAG: hypothetical protein APR54_02935 [Candidatus Cloacimonas sp. SDB]